MKFAELIDAEREQTADDRFQGLCPADVHDLAPSLSQLAHLFWTSRTGKEAGEDCLVGELYKIFNWTLAWIYWPLYTKVCLQMRPPIQWRGGMLCELFKNKGTASSCSNYRDVTIADDGAKTL
eukprot:11563243-Karenia_brevis.AAC.1